MPRGHLDRIGEQVSDLFLMFWRRGGDSNPRYKFRLVRRFSKPLLSTTQPPLRLGANGSTSIYYNPSLARQKRLSAIPGSFVPHGVMHGLTAEGCAVWGGSGSTGGLWAAVTLAIIQAVIHVAVEAIRTVKPRACSDEPSANEPFRPIVTVRGAIVRRRLIVPVGTNRGTAGDSTGHHYVSRTARRQKNSDANCEST